MNDLIIAIKEVEQRTNMLGYALVETLNGNYVLKPLAKAEARGDSIEMEFWGPDMDSIKAQKKRAYCSNESRWLTITNGGY